MRRRASSKSAADDKYTSATTAAAEGAASSSSSAAFDDDEADEADGKVTRIRLGHIRTALATGATEIEIFTIERVYRFRLLKATPSV